VRESVCNRDQVLASAGHTCFQHETPTAVPNTTSTQKAVLHRSVQYPSATTSSTCSDKLSCCVNSPERLALALHHLKAWCHLCIGGSCWGAAVAQQDSTEQVMLCTVLSTHLRTDTRSRPGNTHSTPWCDRAAAGQGRKSALLHSSKSRHHCCFKVLLLRVAQSCCYLSSRPAVLRLPPSLLSCEMQPNWQKGVGPCCQPKL
jgi:hypothetical protein